MPEFAGDGLHGIAQALTALRDQDPAFNKVFAKKQWDRGAVIATEQDLTEKMYVLMSGRVNMVCTNNEGRRLVVTTLEPGAIFGEGALDNRADPNVFAEAAENVDRVGRAGQRSPTSRREVSDPELGPAADLR